MAGYMPVSSAYRAVHSITRHTWKAGGGQATKIIADSSTLAVCSHVVAALLTASSCGGVKITCPPTLATPGVRFYFVLTRPDHTGFGCGYAFSTKYVTTPKFEPAPRMPQKRSAFSFSLAVKMLPSAITTVACNSHLARTLVRKDHGLPERDCRLPNHELRSAIHNHHPG